MGVIGLVSAYILIAFYLSFKLSGCNMTGKLLTDRQRHPCIRRDSGIVCSYMPKDVPPGTKTVYLRNLSSTYFPNSTLRKGSFATYNWGQVKQLEICVDEDWLDKHETVKVFHSSCFVGLHSLEVLHISISKFFKFTSQTFIGLNNLKLIDLSGCRRFNLDNLLTSLKHVTNLQGLNLSRLDSYRVGLKLDDRFFKLISEKQIKELDVSSTQVRNMNLTSFFINCKFLEFLNISRSKFNLDEYKLSDQLCPNLKYIDAGDIILPSSALPDRGPTSVVSNTTVLIDLNWNMGKNFRNVEYINLSDFTTKRTRYLFENVTVHVFGASKFSLKVLILRENNFERLNVKLIIPNCTFEKFDLSGCNLRYLHPGFISSFLSLTWIDLSRNKLNDMRIENAELFAELFRNLSQLRYISLGSNQLTDLPQNIFRFNSRAEIIDLSNNLLTKLSFETRCLKHLRLLDLTKNIIKNIDSTALKSLDNLPLILNENPIDCSRCDSISFINWLMTSNYTMKYVSELKCENEKSEEKYIDNRVIANLKQICIRPKVIITSSIVSLFAIVMTVVALLTIRRYRRRRQYQLEMEERIALIRHGTEAYTFVVFLSYSSKDDDFINNNVYDPLNEHLQGMIGEDRDLVSEGDRDFQLGRPIPEQISILLKKSSVVVVLLTDNYSRSGHCRNEFNQAFMLEKPIMLMIKDQVDIGLMTPLIRDFYEKRTRILWMLENDQYVLKTSWENRNEIYPVV